MVKWLQGYDAKYLKMGKIMKKVIMILQGLGLCLVGDMAHKISDNSYVTISGGDDKFDKIGVY